MFFGFLRLVLASPHFVLASLHAVLVSLRVAVSSLQFVLAFLQVVAPSRHVAVVFRHVVAMPLDVVLSSMQIDSAEPRVVMARLLKWERWRASGSGIVRCSKRIVSRSKRFRENLSPVY